MELTGPSPQITWIEQDKDWRGKITLDGITFVIDFWHLYSDKDWTAGFHQDPFDPEPVPMQTLFKLFQVLEQAIIDLFNNTPVMKLKIHPEALDSQRQKKIQTRNQNNQASRDFDTSKFNAYQLLFQHSRLKQLGFNMQISGENLIISRTI